MTRFVPHYEVVSFDTLRPYMSMAALARLHKTMEKPASVYIAVFPYFCGTSAGNISLYARGADYHSVVMRFLRSKMRALKKKYPAWQFVPLVDASPLPEVATACLAGLGKKGRHGLLITPEYGSYVFLGAILSDLATDAPAEKTQPEKEDLLHPACTGCDSCLVSCPSGHLAHVERPCLSHCTQKKGALTEEEQALIAKSNTIWGCDICQLACPLNKNAATTPIADFTGELLSSLTCDTLNALSEEAFAARAFCFRGRAPLERNLQLTTVKNNCGEGGQLHALAL